MAFVGMFALGIFVGGVVTLGLKEATKSTDNFLKIMAAVLTAALSGSVVGFMDKYKVTDVKATDFKSFFMYPVGLLVALVWLYFEDVWGQNNRLLRWGGVVSIVLISIIATALALSSQFRAWVE